MVEEHESLKEVVKEKKRNLKKRRLRRRIRGLRMRGGAGVDQGVVSEDD